jgi:hypothetical protein
MRERVNIDDLLLYTENQRVKEGKPMLTDIIPIVNSFKHYIDNGGIRKIQEEEMFKIK